MDILIKKCKICEVEKLGLTEFKKFRLVCRICDSKKNYNAYKDKFKEYYIKDQEKRLAYQKEYTIKKNGGKIRKIGRPRSVNVLVGAELNEL